jgi:enoyl-CoA hydratase/carnithine racemase
MSRYDFRLLRVSVRDGVAFVTIDNPPINLLDGPLTRELGALGKELAADPAVRVVVFQSADPDFFIAHSDVGDLRGLPPAPAARPAGPGPFHRIVDRFRTMPKVTMAKVEGRARGGGCEFLMALDMRFAALGRAVFGLPEVSVGLLPGGGGTQRLPRLVGRARALEMILGCGDYDAATAERYGLVNRALPPGDLAPFVEELASRIASFPAEALASAKAAVVLADRPLDDGLVEEEMLFRAVLDTSEARRRMDRFLDLGGQTRPFETRPMEESFAPLAGTLTPAGR